MLVSKEWLNEFIKIDAGIEEGNIVRILDYEFEWRK